MANFFDTNHGNRRESFVKITDVSGNFAKVKELYFGDTGEIPIGCKEVKVGDCLKAVVDTESFNKSVYFK